MRNITQCESCSVHVIALTRVDQSQQDTGYSDCVLNRKLLTTWPAHDLESSVTTVLSFCLLDWLYVQRRWWMFKRLLRPKMCEKTNRMLRKRTRGTHLASCTMGAVAFLGVKRPGRGAGHPPLLVPGSRMGRATRLLPLWALGSLL
jgi:hypothetical protein